MESGIWSMSSNTFPNYSRALLILSKQSAYSTLFQKVTEHTSTAWHILCQLASVPGNVPAHITFTIIVSDSLGVLMRDCSSLGPSAVLHLFKGSTAHHERETVEKIRHGN